MNYKLDALSRLMGAKNVKYISGEVRCDEHRRHVSVEFVTNRDRYKDGGMWEFNVQYVDGVLKRAVQWNFVHARSEPVEYEEIEDVDQH